MRRAARERRRPSVPCAPAGAQPGEVLVDHPPGLAREREVLRVEQPVADQPVDESVQPDGGAARVHAGGQEPAADGVAHAALDLAQAVRAHLDVTVADPRHLVHVLALVADDLEHAPRLRVVGRLAQHRDHAAADVAERISEGVVARASDHLLHRQRHAREHRGEEIGLVAEVPVDRAAGHAGSCGDVLERRARGPAAAEYPFRRVENAVACRRASALVRLAICLTPSISLPRVVVRAPIRCRRASRPHNFSARTLHTFTHVCKLPLQEYRASRFARVRHRHQGFRNDALHRRRARVHAQRIVPVALAAVLAACGRRAEPAGGAGCRRRRLRRSRSRRRRLPVAFEYTGQTAGSREVEVRARVTGILLKRNFEEGAAGQAGPVAVHTSIRRRSRPRSARAEADVAAAEARLAQAQRNAARLKPLYRRQGGEPEGVRRRGVAPSRSPPPT